MSRINRTESQQTLLATIAINLAGLKYEVEHDTLILTMPTEPVDLLPLLDQFDYLNERDRGQLGNELLATIRQFQVKQLFAERIL